VTSGWADSVAATVANDVLVALGPASAGSQLLAQGIQLELGVGATVQIPNVTVLLAGTPFVGQG